MKANNLVVKCFAKETEGVWVAICLDLGLATQAETFDEAKSKLEEQIFFYVEEALQDDRYGAQLLKRKAPLSSWLEYGFILFKRHFLNRRLLRGRFSDKPAKVYDEMLPLRLA